MKLYNAPSCKVILIQSTAILSGSELSTGTYNGQQTLSRYRGKIEEDWNDEELSW